ncbi:MAG: hypothetical protein E3K37_09085 [Candidatus Kuenenia sp.]|nr:hypothetical protein [Candidatus Kuenenia hertensis]
MEWRINKGNTECSACVKKFKEEEDYYSALFDENENFTRKDFCADCWKKGTLDNLFSFWKTKMPRQDKPVQKFVNIDLILDIFCRLEGSEETHKRNLRYVLALYLIRKKLFKFKNLQKQEDKEFIVVQYSKEDKEYFVFNPDINEEEIESLTSEMVQLIEYPYMEQSILSNA